MPTGVKSVIFDCVDNYGGVYLGIRSIEFLDSNDNVITLTEANGDFTAYATNEYEPDYKAEFAFDTSLSKTGVPTEKIWMVPEVSTEQRLIVVFTNLLDFYKIQVNNFHAEGDYTISGAKNVDIYTSENEVTNTTFGADTGNYTHLGSFVFDQHVASDEIDNQVFDVILEEILEPSIGSASLYSHSFIYYPPTYSVYTGILGADAKEPGFRLTAFSNVKSIIMDLHDNYGADSIGMRSVEFLKDFQTPIELLEENGDFTTYATEGPELKLQVFDTGNGHVIALNEDGTVTARGCDNWNQCSGTTGWTNIRTVAAAMRYSVGLTFDGELLITDIDVQNNSNFEAMRNADLLAVAGGKTHVIAMDTAGLIYTAAMPEAYYVHEFPNSDLGHSCNNCRSCQSQGCAMESCCGSTPWAFIYLDNGSPVVHQDSADHGYEQSCDTWDAKYDFSDWPDDIIYIAPSHQGTFGIRENGDVVKTGDGTGYEGSWLPRVTVDNGWHDLLSIDAGKRGCVGVKKDGTIIYEKLDIVDYRVKSTIFSAIDEINDAIDVRVMDGAAANAVILRENGKLVALECINL